MAQFCVEIPDDKIEMVIASMCGQYKYKEQVLNPEFDRSQEEDPLTNPKFIENPEKPYMFVNRITREWIVNNVKTYQSKLAAESARKAAAAAASVNIIDPHQTG